VLALGLAIIILGRILGLTPLYMIGSAAIILVGAAVAWVRLHRFELVASRVLRPARVEMGSTATVELLVSNYGIRRSPVLLASDPLDGGQQVAAFALAPLQPGEIGKAVYRIPAEQRGTLWVGPLDLELRDPFGVASIHVQATDTSRLIVLPRIERVPAPPAGLGAHPDSGLHQPTLRGRRGEDFYSLRSYTVGDDLRRVHWPSTARLDELMIRQDERPRQDQVAVFLDRRRAVHDRTSLELAVSAAASIVASVAWRGRGLVRLVDTSGADTGYGIGTAHAERIMDRLAQVAADGPSSWSPGLHRIRSQPGSGLLVFVTTEAAGDSEVKGLEHLHPRFSPITVMVDGPEGTSPAGRASDGGRRVVRCGPGRPFRVAWTAAVGDGRVTAPGWRPHLTVTRRAGGRR
jgi:uncharacterized protein (DUF58 family)